MMIVKGKRGLLFGIGATLGIILGILCTGAGIRQVLTSQSRLSQEAWVTVLSGIILSFTGLFYWLSSVKINRLKIHQKNGFGQAEIRWSDVTTMFVRGNFYGGYNLVLRGRDSKKMFVLTSFFRNEHVLIKAALEAVLANNPNVELNGLARDLVHQPPYNVLKLHESTAAEIKSDKVYKTETFRRQ